MDSAEAVTKFLTKEVAVIGFFADKESDAAKAYIAAADGIDDVEFGIVSDSAIAAEHKVEGDKIVLFKKVHTKDFSFVLDIMQHFRLP